jgi:hypothetical protein
LHCPERLWRIKGPVQGSLLENLLQGSKIPEVERRKLQSTSLKGLGGNHRGSGYRGRLNHELCQPHLHHLVSEIIANWRQRVGGRGGRVGKHCGNSTDGGGKKARSDVICCSCSPYHIQITHLVFVLGTGRSRLLIHTQLLTPGMDCLYRLCFSFQGRPFAFYTDNPSAFPSCRSCSSIPHSCHMPPCLLKTRWMSMNILLLIGPRMPLQIMCQWASSLERHARWLSARMHYTALCPWVLHLKHSLVHMGAGPSLSGTSVVSIIMSPSFLPAVHWVICCLYTTWPTSVSGWCR